MANSRFVVLISADGEWAPTLEIQSPKQIEETPLGQTFVLESPNGLVRYFHSGWGKISSAAATQYVIDTFHPELLVNLGTCGGLAGHVNIGEILLVRETVLYDVIESMADYTQAIDYYRSYADISWLTGPLPENTRISRMASADQDIRPQSYAKIFGEFGAPAADWESGAIAWTATCNGVPWLILRGVTDLVSPTAAEADGQLALWQERTRDVMEMLLTDLPWYLSEFNQKRQKSLE